MGAEPVDFRRDVEPILVEHCYECHGPGKREGDLRLTSRKSAFAGGNTGIPVIEPGRSDLSPLIDLVTAADPKERMPHDRLPLSARDIDVLRRWIDEGAAWPDGGPAPHWAYLAPSRPALPAVADVDWPAKEIDVFVLSRLERDGLSPSPPADPATLLRRVHLDLTGIPPTPAELDAFLAKPTFDAYRGVVDRLLASPRFGEHWAREWLDAARHADSNGFKADALRQSWVYRDWVIRAINDDVPFDRFTIQQIAGDLLSDATQEDYVATGFLRGSPLSVEAGVDAEEARIDQVRDRVNTIATAWLGSTLECAQCHDHKFDPFSQEEYYRFFAYLNNSPIESEAAGAFMRYGGPHLDVVLTPEVARQKEDHERRLHELRQEFQRSLPPKAAIDGWIRRMIGVRGPSRGWKRADVDSFDTSEPERTRHLADGSVLLPPAGPPVSTYRATLTTDLPRVTGVRIEALPHDSLPSAGPGRGVMSEPTYLVGEVAVRDGRGVAVPVRAFASSEADGAEAALAADGDARSGWAVAKADARDAQWLGLVLPAAAPLLPDAEGRVRLEVVVEQNGGAGQTIGRIAFGVTDVSPEILDLPVAIQERLAADEAAAVADRPLRLEVMNHLGRPDLVPLMRQLAHKIGALERATAPIIVERAEPRTTRLFRRGNHLDPGEKVRPGTPSVLHPLPADAPPNRLGLARWLVDPANPLTTRVTVNRWWAQIFGRGIVDSVEDFGTRGSRPANQPLLDWLATELAATGSRKHVLREIVTSATYRQASRFDSRQGPLVDPENRLLWRMPRLRLPAETIRDQALAIGGVLAERIGGPPVYPPQPPKLWNLAGGLNPPYTTELDEDRYRRGVYVVWRRVAPYPTFSLFDAPDRASCTVQRSRTNTPLQALALMNDEVYVDMAMALAARILAESPGPDDARLRHAVRVTLAREPMPGELRLLRRHLVASRDRVAAEPDDLARLATSAAGRRLAEAAPLDRAELAAWFSVATVLLNLDETITRS